MESSWSRVSLDELYEFSSGLSKPRADFGSGYPFLSFKDVFYNSAVPKLTELVNSTERERLRCSVSRGDVFLTRTSETMDELGMSSVALTDIPNATFNGFTKRLRPKDERRVVPEFARYYFRSQEFRNSVTAMSSMSTRASLNNEMLARLTIVLPPPGEQRAIAAILGALDDKIELNREMSETLEAIARTIFKAWFIDFEPVVAKMDGRWQQGQSLPGFPAHLFHFFPRKLTDSDIGEVPESWSVQTVETGFNVTMGQSPPGETYNETGDGLPFYQGRTDFTFRFPNRRVYCTAPTRLAKPSDTLVSVRAPVGDVNMATEDCAIGRGVAAVRHKTGNRSYTYYAMKALETVFARFEAEGTVFGSINKKDFYSLKTIGPPTELLTEFEKLCGPMDDAIERNDLESRILTELRDTLLSKLISGELRVKDVEQVVAGSLS